MENVIVVSGNKNIAESLELFFRESFGCNVKQIESASSARNLSYSDYNFDLAVINVPLPDESGLKLAEYITENSAASCLLLVKAENADNAREAVDKYGVIVIPKPFTRNAIYQTVRIVETASRRFYSLYEQTVKLERKIEEIKLVDKAKFMLMQYRNITEEEAHSYLEQYAMNKRMRKSIAASEIIDKINEHYM